MRSLVLWVLTALLCTGSVSAADGLLPQKNQPPDFLPVDRAFELQPLEWREGRLEISWRIAKGYYLYRDRLQFTLTEPAGVPLGSAVLPAAEKHQDEHFGVTEIYRGALRTELPLTSRARTVKLTVSYQGCADAGLCYPIQTRTLEARR
ncbi:MAG: hypothetical protein L0Y32_01860 [Nevskiales bacterium]|nr:hypothetical protein [Nevskiales bacterium]